MIIKNLYLFIIGGLLILMVYLGLNLYIDSNKINSLNIKIENLQTNLENKKIELQTQKLNCDMLKFELASKLKIDLKKEEPYEKISNEDGNYTISF